MKKIFIFVALVLALGLDLVSGQGLGYDSVLEKKLRDALTKQREVLVQSLVFIQAKKDSTCLAWMIGAMQKAGVTVDSTKVRHYNIDEGGGGIVFYCSSLFFDRYRFYDGKWEMQLTTHSTSPFGPQSDKNLLYKWVMLQTKIIPPLQQKGCATIRVLCPGDDGTFLVSIAHEEFTRFIPGRLDGEAYDGLHLQLNMDGEIIGTWSMYPGAIYRAIMNAKTTDKLDFAKLHKLYLSLGGRR